MMNSITKMENKSCCFKAIESDQVRLIWEITGRCNLRCVHCFAHVDPENMLDEELTTIEALHIIKQLKDINVGKVMLTGGEPLVRKDIAQIIQGIRKQSKDIIIDLSTNGLLISDGLLNCLKESDVKEVSVSLDGPEKTYRRIRGCNVDFQKVLRNIKKLTEIGIKVSTTVVLSKETIGTLEETAKLAQEIGIVCLSVADLVKIQDSDFDYELLKLSEEEKKKAFFRVSLLQKKYENQMVIRTVRFQPCMGSSNCGNKNIIAINRRGMYLHCLSSYKDGDVLLNSRNYTLKQAYEMLLCNFK